MCLYYKSRKASGSKLTSPPRAQEAHCKQQQTESSIGTVQRSRVRHVPEREPRLRASKWQIKHRPIPPHPVYKRLRFQVCQDYPQVLQRVLPLYLEGVTEQVRRAVLVQWFIVYDETTFSQKHPRRGRVREDMAANRLQGSTSNECHCCTRVSYNKVRLCMDLDVEYRIYIALGSWEVSRSSFCGG